MATPTKKLMDLFYEEGRLAAKNGDYRRKLTFDAAENAVNNIMHGRPPLEVFEQVEKTLTLLAEREDSKGDEVAALAYRDAVLMLTILREDLLRRDAQRA